MVATHLEKLGNLRVIREKSGKTYSCMWSVTATQNMQKKFFTVLHIEHREYMSIAVRNNIHSVLYCCCCKGRYSVNIHLTYQAKSEGI